MNILYVCHRVPFPPNRGGKIRPFNMISHFAKSHSVTVASMARSQQELDDSSGLNDFCDEVICVVVNPAQAAASMALNGLLQKPLSFGYFDSGALRKRIRRALLTKPFDLIFVHCSSAAQYVADVRDIPKILDFGDMDSQKWLDYAEFRSFPMSLVYRYEGTHMEAIERRLAAQFDLCTCTTRLELETLNGFSSGVPTDWFPNGVDHTRFVPADEPYDAKSISFIGRMDYYPNQQAMLHFCERVLPLVRARIPDVTLDIVGAKPNSAVRRLARLPGVTVTGFVPEVAPYVTRSAVNVAPLEIARGTQNKVLEAMAMGVPVVATRKAAAGVDAEPGHDLICADQPMEMADEIVRLMEDPALRRKFAAAGRSRVLSHHDWRESMCRLDEIVARVA